MLHFAEKVGSTKAKRFRKSDSELEFRAAAVCGPGKVRIQNQDNLYIDGKIRKKPDFAHVGRKKACLMVAVADGMGGETHGELASLAAVKIIRKAPPRNAEQMRQVGVSANEAVCKMMLHYGERIGSTLTMLALQGTVAYMSNLGDSRCYLLRKGELKKISTDHTQVQQMVDLGVLTPEQAATHKSRHKLTQHLGIFPEEMIIEPAMVELEVCEGDVFLLCSDGLTDMLDDIQIAEKLQEEGTIKEKADALFSQAMQNGGRDNITVLLIEVAGRRKDKNG